MPESIDTGSLIQLCNKRNSSAWARFIEHFSSLIFWAIKNKISSLHLKLPETDIYDIYQQVFLSIWQKQRLKDIRNPKSISRWLIIVAQGEAVNYVKSKHLQKQKRTGIIEETDATSAYTAREETHNKELEEEIVLFIDALPLKERRIATLDILYDLKYELISKIVNLPIGTISSVIKRIKTDLKQHLLEKGYMI